MTDDDSLPDRKPRKPHAFWADPQHDDVLRFGWDSCWSTLAIANVIGDGCTRNAVIGRARRLKLPSHPNKPTTRMTRFRVPTTPKRDGRENQGMLNRMATKQQTNIYNKQPKAPTVPLPNVIDDAIPVGQRRSLLQLEFNHCRWPVGDPRDPSFFFCGAECKGTYCAVHAKRGAAPPYYRIRT